MQTPTQQILARAAETSTVHDALGRELIVRRLTALDRLRLFKTIGATLSQNSPYLGMATLASSVTVLDGVPVPTSTTEAQLEALVGRLGDAGIAAVAEALSLVAVPVQKDNGQGN